MKSFKFSKIPSLLIVKVFLLWLILFLPHLVSAQTDREFWFVAPYINDEGRDFDKPIDLRITTMSTPATVVISMPADPSFIPITQNIGANSTASIDLTAWISQLQSTPANSVLNKGLLIKSTTDITAYYEVVSGFCNCDPEVFSLKGKNALGNEFFISSQYTYDESTAYNSSNSFDIVATVDNTHVTITPTKDIVGHNANIPFTVILNKGQTYSAVAVSKVAAGHLQGSYITSDNPIAVTLKDDLVQVSSCADLIGDQTVPTNVLGTEYIVTKGFLSPNDNIYVLAVANGTSVYVDGNSTPVAVLAKGESVTLNLSNPSTYIRSNQNVYVYQLTGNGCEVGSAIIPKINCTGSQTVSIVRSNSDLFAVMITTKNGNQNNFTVNGNNTLIKSSDFAPVPGTGGAYVTARVDLSGAVSVGSALNFSNSTGKFSLGYINGGTNDGVLYGFFSDFKSSNVQNSSVETCPSGSAQLSAYGGVTYKWSPATGLSDPNIANPIASPTVTTDYKVTITSADGCVDYADVLVKVSGGLIANFSIPQEIAPAIIDASPGPDGVRRISIIVHNGTNVSAVTPTITASNGADVLPASGAVQNFTNPVNYTVNPSCPPASYTAQVFYARTASTCTGTSATITGDTPTPAGALQWQILTIVNGTNTWVAATGTNNGINYQTQALTNTTNAPIIFTFRRQITTAFGTTYDSYYDVTVYPALINNYDISQPPGSPMVFCGTTDAEFLNAPGPAGGNGIYTYQWQSAPDGSHFTDIPGAILQGYNAPASTSTISYRRIIKSSNCVQLISNVITLTVIPVVSPGTITPPPITSFCGVSSGSTLIVGSIATGGNGVYNYQWQSSADNVNFTDVNGATTKDYDPSVINTSTYYRRTVTSGACVTPQVSNVVSLNIIPAIANNNATAPAVTSFCVSGDPGNILGSTPMGSDGTYAYKWQSSTDNINFTDIPGAIAKDFDPPVITVTTYFRRTITSGVCTVPAVSNVITITVLPIVTNNNITAPATSSFCVSGDPSTITGSTPMGGDGTTYTYQWQSSTDNINFTNITGAVSKDYDPSALSVTTYFQRTAISGACTTPVISNIVTITILPALGNNSISPPLITNFCSSVNPDIIPGNFPSGGGGAGTYNYQWQSSTDGINFNDIPGANGVDYDPPPFSVSTSFRRNVTSGACNVPLSSNVITFTIKTSPTIVLLDAVPPICAGNTAIINVISPQADLTYNWYDSPAKINLVFTGTSFTTPVLNAPKTYYVEATNGTCSSPALASVQVIVNNLPTQPALVKNPVSVCSNTLAILDVLNPQPALIYSWYSTPSGGSSVFTGTEFTTPPITGNITYYVEAKNSSGCVSSIRTAVSVIVNPLPQVSVQGASICPNTSTMLTASSTDQNAVINWYLSATSNSILFTGNTFSTTVLNSNTTYYAEAVDNVTGCISATRSPAQVTMLQQLAAPVVNVSATTVTSITFKWDDVSGATGYQVSTDNGQTFSDPSSGSNGLTHTVSGLSLQQSITIIVRALGTTTCQLSNNSAAVTGTAIHPLEDQIFVANAFTPNGDGKNDVVYVHSPSIKSLKFYVYDQWGELLYTSLSQSNGWDGTFKGKKEPVGVYVYYLEAIMNDGRKLTKKGTITLLR